MIKISVIVPFYNTEEVLFQKCIQSLLNQTFQDFEILLINDGSKHEHDNMIESVVKLDNRIRYFYQENQGVSAARNKGVSLAKGEFIVFVDSDDFVIPKFLEEAYDVAIINNVDFVIGGSRLFDNIHNQFELNTNESQSVSNIKVYTENEIKKLRVNFISPHVVTFEGGHLGRGPVSRLIRTSLARKVLFPLNVPYGEDIIWNQRVFELCERVALVEQVWYLYYTNSASVTHSYNPKSIELVELQLNLLHKALIPCENEIYYEFVNRMFEGIHGEICNNYLTNVKCDLSFMNRYRLFNSLKKREPWDLIDRKYLSYATCREKLIYFAFKKGILFPIMYLLR